MYWTLIFIQHNYLQCLMSNELLIACVIVGVDLTHLLVRKEGVVALLLGL